MFGRRIKVEKQGRKTQKGFQLFTSILKWEKVAYALSPLFHFKFLQPDKLHRL